MGFSVLIFAVDRRCPTALNCRVVASFFFLRVNHLAASVSGFSRSLLSPQLLNLTSNINGFRNPVCM